MSEIHFQRHYAKHQLQRHSTEYASAQCEFLQPLSFAIDQSWSISAKRWQNCYSNAQKQQIIFVQKRDGRTEVEIHISENKNEMDNRKIWSLERRKVWAKRSTDVDMKANFHGMLREESKQRVHLCPRAVLQVLWAEVQPPAISPGQRLCHRAGTEQELSSQGPLPGLTATAAQPGGEWTSQLSVNRDLRISTATSKSGVSSTVTEISCSKII